eukprot:gene15634-18539_t
MCEGDPSSVVMRVSVAPVCMWTSSSDCRFDMHDFQQLDATLDMANCKGTWSAPLWMTPDHWSGGGASGEVDMVEQCPAESLCSNFAGGGKQKCFSRFTPDNFHGHVTMRKEATGRVTVSICEGNTSCDLKDGASYSNIYASNGCHNQNCMFRLMSDIWLATDGDKGWRSCSKSTYKKDSRCAFSISDIRIASSQPFSGKCAAVNPTTVDAVLLRYPHNYSRLIT